MDMNLFVACLAVAVFGGFAIGYMVRDIQPDWRGHEPTEDGRRPL